MRVQNKHIIADGDADQALACAMELAKEYGENRDVVLFTTQDYRDIQVAYPDNMMKGLYICRVACTTTADKLTETLRSVKQHRTGRGLCIVMDCLCPMTVKVIQGCIREAQLDHDTYIEAKVDHSAMSALAAWASAATGTMQ